MASLDTTKEAAAVQLAIYRRIGKAARFSLAAEMSDAVMALTRTGIESRHPAYTDRQIIEELVRLVHGIERTVS